MRPTDHKAVLRKLAEEDGCEASKRAAGYIEYIEKQLTSSRDYAENLRRKLVRVRHQRDELRRQLMEKGNGGNISICADHTGDMADRRGDDCCDDGAAVEHV